MAAKRLLAGSDDKDSSNKPPEEKRLRALPSFSTVIREAVTAKQQQKIMELLEPLFRRVVREVVEDVIVNGLNTTPSIPRSPATPKMQIEAAAAPAGEAVSNLKLVFRSPLSLPIFTGTRILDSDSNPLQILLVDTTTRSNGGGASCSVPARLRVELVVLSGDFPCEGAGSYDDDDDDEEENMTSLSWSSNDFDRAIVRERRGKRPLLTGDHVHHGLTLGGGQGVASVGNLVVTDNSSWIRSQHFRLGARIHPGCTVYQGPRIKEAITQRFRVKDQRGELCKKHYPPALNDEVWRLDKISKDGIFHKRLAAEDINTVQDLLKLATVDAAQLRKILGVGMTDRVWGLVIEHARTCLISGACAKLYIYCKQNYAIVLNSICEIIRIQIDGIPANSSPQGLDRYHKAYIEEMVREAYSHWALLEEYDGVLCNNSLPQTDPILQLEAIEELAAASTSTWYPGQPEESPEFQIDEFDQGCNHWCYNNSMEPCQYS